MGPFDRKRAWQGAGTTDPVNIITHQPFVLEITRSS